MKPQGLQTGVTLIELLVTLAVATIVLTLGVAGFRELFTSTKMTNAANSVMGHLQFARSEAIKRSARVRVCPSADGESCRGGNPAIWSDGYVVVAMDKCVGGSTCVDADGDGAVDDLLLLRVDGEEMRALNANSGGRPGITFHEDGSAEGTNGTVKICDPADNSDIRLVVVYQTGRTRVSCGVPDAYTCQQTCP